MSKRIFHLMLIYLICCLVFLNCLKLQNKIKTESQANILIDTYVFIKDKTDLCFTVDADRTKNNLTPQPCTKELEEQQKFILTWVIDGVYSVLSKYNLKILTESIVNKNYVVTLEKPSCTTYQKWLIQDHIYDDRIMFRNKESARCLNSEDTPSGVTLIICDCDINSDSQQFYFEVIPSS